jgi:hypothetical protein
MWIKIISILETKNVINILQKVNIISSYRKSKQQILDWKY